MTERQAELVRKFSKSSIGRYFGMSLSYDEEGHAHVHLPYNPDLDHALGGVHGGILATLLDTAGWFAAAVLHDGAWIATTNLNIHLLEPAAQVDLEAEGRVVRRGRRVDVAEMRVADPDGKLYAIATGTFIVVEGVSF
ncbi:MAG: PaaI family thioesterase [Candidatus Bipolaricaulia bacterium]